MSEQAVNLYRPSEVFDRIATTGLSVMQFCLNAYHGSAKPRPLTREELRNVRLDAVALGHGHVASYLRRALDRLT